VTYAFFPDETHKSIRRTFSSGGAAAGSSPAAQRQFCGYCGTQLSAWNEATLDDAGHINVNLGSLEEEDVALLNEWGLLAPEDSEDPAAETGQGGPFGEADVGASSSAPRESRRTSHAVQGMTHRGAPWFEEMVEHSSLGRLRRQRGGYESQDGTTTMQWEVVELTSDGTEVALEDNPSPGKRKRSDSEGMPARDVPMKG
jgi:hypothetical protein